MNKAEKLSDSQYHKNFEDIVVPFTKNAAVVEANRCLFCYDSPCMTACPTHIDIPTFIKKISTENFKGSAKTIFESNWIALTCAKACPVGDLCEGACVMHEKGEKPIEIGRLQRFAVENYFNNGMQKIFDPKPKNGKSVGIIGSGPAGLACGAELVLLGYDVQIYESKNIPGGLNTYGIAPYKLRKEDALKEVKFIEGLGVKIQTNITIGKDISIDDLLKKHDAVFIGAGLGQSTQLDISGEDISGVSGAINFIEDLKSENWKSVDVGKRVAVIGAGNTAIDAATEAKRLGAEQVMILYRRSEEEMPANDFEYELAKKEGIIFHFLTAPVEIIGKDHVEKIKCVKMKLGEKDHRGRRTPIPIPNSEFEIQIDMVVASLGQKTKIDFLEPLKDLKIENGKIVVDKETFHTTHPKIFAGGDCINGGKEVVNAAHDGKHAAIGIDKFLSLK